MRAEAMWANTQADAYPGLILHDCHVSHIEIEEQLLAFSFVGGFWMTLSHRDNQYGKVLRTGESQITYRGAAAEAFSVRLFQRTRFRRRTVLEELPFAALAQRVNSGQWELELVEEYYRVGGALLVGSIRAGGIPYRMECQVTLHYREAVYHWNGIRTHREW